LIRAAIVGVGNIASMLVQSTVFYKLKGHIDGAMTESIGGYGVGDIEYVAAFDVSRRKVGRDLGEAIFESPNSVPRICDVGVLGVKVSPGPVLDGVAPHMREVFEPIDLRVDMDQVVDVLKSSGAEVVVNLLPVGSEEATRFYARASLKAGAAFINAIPVFIASDPSGLWQKLYREAGLPLLGDDVKGQVGATILHRTLIRLLHMRGVVVEETYQLNVGGNTDFLNMLDDNRLYSKRISKTRAVTSMLPYGDRLEMEGRVRIGPSDYVPFLGNTKVAYIYIKGRSFGGLPLTLEAKLSVDDKSMAAAVLVDAIRVARLALDRGHGGVIVGPSAYLFKHPPIQAVDDETSYRWFVEYVERGVDAEISRGSNE